MRTRERSKVLLRQLRGRPFKILIVEMDKRKAWHNTEEEYCRSTMHFKRRKYLLGNEGEVFQGACLKKEGPPGVRLQVCCALMGQKCFLEKGPTVI